MCRLAKHSYARLPRKCDYRTDRQTDGRTDRQTDAGQSDPYVPLCFAGDSKIPQAFKCLLYAFSPYEYGYYTKLM